MRAAALALLACPLIASSGFAQQARDPLASALQQARAEQAAAEAQTARLETAASQARGEADQLRARQAAAAQAIEAAEARITAADMQFQIASAYVAAHRQRLADEQRPIAALLAGLGTMARRPPLLAVTDSGGVDELVKVRILIDSTLPVIRRRTSGIASELSKGRELQQAALSARAETVRSRRDLIARRQQFAALEQQSFKRALAMGGRALSSGDIAIAAGENIEQIGRAQADRRQAYALAERLVAEAAVPASPFAQQAPRPRTAFRYRLPALAPVTEGLAAVNDSGVRSRGITLATARGSLVTAPADGVVRFAGPFRDYDGVLILDHGGGWVSLLVNVSSTLRPGDRVRMGESVGRALGPIEVDLSQNGQRFSPALIAGSSQTLSNAVKGG